MFLYHLKEGSNEMDLPKDDIVCMHACAVMFFLLYQQWPKLKGNQCLHSQAKVNMVTRVSLSIRWEILYFFYKFHKHAFQIQFHTIPSRGVTSRPGSGPDQRGITDLDRLIYIMSMSYHLRWLSKFTHICGGSLPHWLALVPMYDKFSLTEPPPPISDFQPPDHPGTLTHHKPPTAPVQEAWDHNSCSCTLSLKGGMLAQLWNKFDKPDRYLAYLSPMHLNLIIHPMLVYHIPIYFTPSSSSVVGG